MKNLLIILLLFVSLGAGAQKRDSSGLARAMFDLNKSLIKKDTAALNKQLRDDVRYYHSNGWLQVKKDVTEDLYNGKLTYKEISAKIESVHLNGDIGQIRTVLDVDVSLNGKPIQLKLKVVQVWVWKENKWELYSRHSEKITA
jgi:hypothetical protein